MSDLAIAIIVASVFISWELSEIAKAIKGKKEDQE